MLAAIAYTLFLIGLIFANARFWYGWSLHLGDWWLRGVGWMINTAICILPFAFVMAIGKRDLHKRLSHARLVVPVLLCAAGLAGLIWGGIWAFGEWTQSRTLLNEGTPMLAAIAIVWLIIGVLLYAVTRRWRRYTLGTRCARLLILASIAEIALSLSSISVVLLLAKSQRGILVGGPRPGGGLIAGLNVLSCALGVALAFRAMRAKYERDLADSHGICQTCGYDLRASPERCPECGTPVAATLAAAE